MTSRIRRSVVVLALMALLISVATVSALAQGPSSACEQAKSETQKPPFCNGPEHAIYDWWLKTG